MKVLALPHVSEVQNQNHGIARVIEAYWQYLPQFDIELVESNATSYDLKVAHAGITGSDCDVAHLHGIYFTADYNAHEWEWHVNSRVIEACRNAKAITVPSAWVAETFQRDMRLNPHVIPHGIVWQEWQHKENNQGYVLWNKNRNGIDVCDNSALDILIRRFPKVQFVSTLPTVQTETMLSSPMWPPNFRILPHGGKTPHDDMKLIVQRSGVYLSLAKETWGIGTLEAMASGIPVLGWDWGGNSFLVQTGVNGYLAKPNDIDDLCEGLNYCMKHRKILGKNGIELSKAWTWEKACEKVAGVYRLAMEKQPTNVSVVIPVYNKPYDQVKRAVKSVLDQTYQVDKIVLVNDGSTPSTEESIKFSEEFIQRDLGTDKLTFINQTNQGVAAARNNGIAKANSKYVTCLDSDDWLEPRFLEACIAELEKDRSLGIAYTSLRAHNADGTNGISAWPGVFNPDKQLTYPKQDQVPTACVFRREAWERVGGYKSRYCPNGAGSEDAAFWSAICSIGYNAKKVTDESLFNYSAEGGFVHGNKEYVEMDWLSMYPWAKDNLHPFASVATPKRWSHPVRQYDEPVISVIIPVGPGHEQDVTNALDSLEMQHFRKWEVILVWDNTNAGAHGELLKVYPYVRWHWTGGRLGAGYCRNYGVNMARAPLLFFLDADDVLVDAHAFDKMLTAWNREEAVIYSDYLGKAEWEYEKIKAAMGDNLLGYNEKLQTAVFRKYAVDFDCSKAQRQPEFESASPNMPYYHWCLVSVLVPKVWHDEIGGFDESMSTWEDVDYMWRLARYGKCFYRVTDPLVMYSYHKGYRREASAVKDESTRQKHKNLIQYIKNKYEGIQTVGCNCGSKRQTTQMTVTGEASINGMNNNDWVEIEFDFPGSNTRETYGQKLGSPTRQPDPANPNRVMEYKGYDRRKGQRFLVHTKDQRARPDMFKLVSDIKLPEVPKVELAEPVLLVKQRGRRAKVAA